MKQVKKYYRTNTSHYARCRTLMLKFKNRHRLRFFLTSVIMFANCYFHVITLPALYYQENDRIYGLLWGVFGFLVNLIIFITAFCASAERRRLLTLLLILIALASVINFLHPYAGIALGIIYLTQIPEGMKMKWIQKQQGYPYFNERYQLQEDYKRMTADCIEESENPEPPRARPQRIVVFSLPEDKK